MFQIKKACSNCKYGVLQRIPVAGMEIERRRCVYTGKPKMLEHAKRDTGECGPKLSKWELGKMIVHGRDD